MSRSLLAVPLKGESKSRFIKRQALNTIDRFRELGYKEEWKHIMSYIRLLRVGKST